MTILNKIESKDFNLSDNEILELLNINNHSDEFYRLLSVSNKLSREKFGKKGYVFAQLGINAEPCSKNCRFCSLGIEHYSITDQWKKSLEEIKLEVEKLNEYNINDFFMMCTADYSFDDFIRIGKEVKKLLKPEQKFVANVGDFDLEMGQKLKEAGFTGVYHINRLREGIDTLIDVETRENTLQAAQKAKLETYYCIEPIGPEHSYDEILTEIKRAKDLKIEVMAVMRRIPVPGTPLFDSGKISATELTKIAAVTNIVVQPSRSMNAHEPIQMSLLAGINQLYAELGANPRDTANETSSSRGFTPNMAWDMLSEADYEF